MRSWVAVVEPQPLVVAARGGDRGQRVRVDGRTVAGHGDGDGATAADPPSQPRRQHLFELGQRAHRGLLDAGDRAARRGAQADRDRDRLVVVEQQRGQRAPAPSR